MVSRFQACYSVASRCWSGECLGKVNMISCFKYCTVSEEVYFSTIRRYKEINKYSYNIDEEKIIKLKSYSLEHMSGVLLLLTSGLVLSFIAFGMEIFLKFQLLQSSNIY